MAESENHDNMIAMTLATVYAGAYGGVAARTGMCNPHNEALRAVGCFIEIMKRVQPEIWREVKAPETFV